MACLGAGACQVNTFFYEFLLEGLFQLFYFLTCKVGFVCNNERYKKCESSSSDFKMHAVHRQIINVHNVLEV